MHNKAPVTFAVTGLFFSRQGLKRPAKFDR